MKRFHFLFLPILILFWIDSINAQEVLTLSLDEAIFQAIENNLGLKVERYTPLITSQDILIEKGAFDPSLSLEGSESYQDALSPSIVDNIMQRSVDVSFAFSGKVETGTKYKFAWDYQRVKGDSPYLRINPYYFTGFTFAASQPLLKGFGKKIQTTNIKVAEENLKLSEYELRSKAEELSNGTVKTFFEVLFTKESLEISRFSLSFAEKILSDVQAKVKAGYMASVDLYNAEAEVAKREEFVLKAENAYKDTLDSLRRVLGLEDWNKDIILVKPETPSNELPDLTDSIQNAQLYRKDLQQSLIEVEKKKLMTRFYNNQKLPDLELSASAGLTGLSDTRSDAFDRIGISNDNNWKVGLLLKIPLLGKEAKGRYLKAKYEEAQTEELVRELRQRITLEVRNAWRGLSLSLKKIEASKKTRIASEKRMQAEEHRFRSGIASLTDVLQFQEEYIKSLLNEKGAEFDYHISLSEYEKVKGTLLMKFGISDSELGITKATNYHKSSQDSRYGARNSSNYSGTVVKPIAIPDTGSFFSDWSGGGCSGSGQCILSINTDTIVTATSNAEVKKEIQKESPQPQKPSGAIFTIQVGAFRNASYAKALAKRLYEKGYEAYITSFENKDGILFKVCVGKFSNGQEVKNLSEKIKNTEGFQTLVKLF